VFAKSAKYQINTISMRYNDFKPLIESADSNIVIEDFIRYCAKQLEIQKLPNITPVRDIEFSVERSTFGQYDPESNTLYVQLSGRHILDVFRTLAHELVHHKQREEDRLHPDSGQTGSDEENEANAMAGILMRDYGQDHPDLFAHDLGAADEGV
jgi:hypothetical protein